MGEPLRCFVMGDESLLVQCAEILRARGHVVVGVITTDDSVARWAERSGIRVVDKGPGLDERLGDAPFDWFLSIANLSLIPDTVLRRASRGAINFHDGPLPRYAGLNAPVWALLAGEPTHGISWHLIEGGVDEGDLLAQATIEIAPNETALTLNTKCYAAAIESFPRVVAQLESGVLERTAQDLSQRSYFAKAKRPAASATLDFRATADELARLVRALDHGAYANPLTRAKLVVGDAIYLVPSLEPTDTLCDSTPGTVLSIGSVEGALVAAGDRAVRIPTLTRTCGELVDLEAVLASGSVIRSLSDDEASRLGDLDERIARHDPFFRAKLAGLDPVPQPYETLTTAAPEFVTRTVQLEGSTDARTTIAIACALLGRLSAKTIVDVAYASDALREQIRGFEAWYAPSVPLRVDLVAASGLDDLTSALSVELDSLDRRATYGRDLIARSPELVFAAMPVGVLVTATGGAPIPGTSLTFAIDGSGQLVVHADVSRVDATMVDELVRRITGFAKAALADRSAPLTSIELLDDGERHAIVVGANATAVDYERDLTMHQAFERQVDRQPDATALIYERTALTYRELDARANRVAAVLRAQGVGPDALVGLFCKRGPNLVVAALAVHKAGGAYVPLDPAYPRDRLAGMLEDSRAAVVLSESAIAAEVPADGVTVIRVDDDPRVAAASDARVDPGTRGEHLAYVIYTSGSTGRPKGVMVEHRNVANFMVGMDDRIPFGRDRQPVWLAVTSLSFDISVLELFWTLQRGFAIVMSSDEDRALVGGGNARPAGPPVDFSLFYFSSDEGENARDKYKLLVDGAKFADANGFSAVWTPERHFHAFGGLYPNPSVTSAALATITSRVKLRAGSCVVPLHHPARVAEEWALVDNLSDGRVEISFAAGWQPNDFVFRPENFADAKGAMERDIETVRALWRGEARTFEGPKGPVEVRTLPRPVQKELPFFVTAAGNPETFALAGRMGASILTHLLGQSVEELQAKIRVYRDARAAAGNAGPGHVALMLHTYVGQDVAAVKEKVRAPMTAYLRSSMELIKQHAWSFPAFKKAASAEVSFADNFQSLSDSDRDALLDHAFERYYETSGLFGTASSCVAMVDRIRGAGVDEIACLIDFGVDSASVLESLPRLLELKERSAPATVAAEDDYSIAAQVVRHRVTHLQCTPSMARMIVTNGEARAALRSLEFVMLGGEALPGALVRELSELSPAAVENMYGPTETTIWSSTARATAVDGVVPIGTPIANTQLYVLDAARRAQPFGIPGELYIGGDGVTRGYLHRPELSAEKFVPNPFRPGERMYATGDLVKRMPDGRIDFLGRVDFQVKIRGYRIELGEIETRLAAVPGVREGVVVAREDVPGDKRLVAYFTTTGAGVDESTLRASLEADLPAHMIPSHFVRLDRFPLTPNAKVDRKALPKPDLGATSKAEYVVPSNAIEETIAAVFQRLLGIARVGAKDNFFELGGHSLLAVQAHREIREALGLEMTITDLFRYPTVAGLSAHLDRDGSDAKSGDSDLAKTADRAAARREAMKRARGGSIRPRA